VPALLCASFALSFVAVLLVFVLYMTFVPGLPIDPGLTLAHWAGIVDRRMFSEVIPNTLVVGIGTVLVATCFAFPISWLLNRTNVPLRNMFITLMAVVVVVPGFTKAMGWIMLVDERIGLVNTALASLLRVDRVPITLVNSLLGIAWVMGLTLTPMIFFLISGSMRAMDPTLEEAAEVAGLGQSDRIFRVTMPLIWPAVLAGMIYTFMTAISIFEIPALLGAAGGKVPVLATELFYAVKPGGNELGDIRYGAAGVYGVLIAVPSAVGLYFYLKMVTRARRYEVISGKGYRPRDIDLGRAKWPAFAFVVTYLALGLVLPVAVLLWASLLPILQMPSAAAFAKVSLANYQNLFINIGGASVLGNTIALVISVSLLVTFFGVMISWVVVRSDFRLRKLMDIVAMLPHAIPGLAFAFALAMLAIVLQKWVPAVSLTETLLIIIAANVITWLSYGTRVTSAALLQVQRDLEDCGKVCGLTSSAIIPAIIVPLIKPSLVFVALWTGLLTSREVTMALFLAGPGNQVLSVSIWTLWNNGVTGVAAAGAVAMVAVLGVLTLIVLRVIVGRAPATLARV
jgi:iron(III) transport system permease protein